MGGGPFGTTIAIDFIPVRHTNRAPVLIITLPTTPAKGADFLCRNSISGIRGVDSGGAGRQGTEDRDEGQFGIHASPFPLFPVLFPPHKHIQQWA